MRHFVAENDAIYLIGEINAFQDDSDNSPAGMLSYDQWSTVWANYPAEGLRDLVNQFFILPNT